MGRALESAPEGGVLLHAVGGAGQCAPGFGGLAEEIERLRAEPDDKGNTTIDVAVTWTAMEPRWVAADRAGLAAVRHDH